MSIPVSQEFGPWTVDGGPWDGTPNAENPSVHGSRSTVHGLEGAFLPLLLATLAPQGQAATQQAMGEGARGQVGDHRLPSGGGEGPGASSQDAARGRVPAPFLLAAAAWGASLPMEQGVPLPGAGIQDGGTGSTADNSPSAAAEETPLPLHLAASPRAGQAGSGTPVAARAAPQQAAAALGQIIDSGSPTAAGSQEAHALTRAGQADALRDPDLGLARAERRTPNTEHPMDTRLPTDARMQGTGVPAARQTDSQPARSQEVTTQQAASLTRSSPAVTVSADGQTPPTAPTSAAAQTPATGQNPAAAQVSAAAQTPTVAQPSAGSADGHSVPPTNDENVALRPPEASPRSTATPAASSGAPSESSGADAARQQPATTTWLAPAATQAPALSQRETATAGPSLLQQGTPAPVTGVQGPGQAGVEAAPDTPVTGTRDLAPVLTERIVQQARILQGGGGSSFHMRLEPPSLGGLEVRVTSAAEGIRITVLADRREGHHVVQAGLADLTGAIRERGIVVQQADVWLNSPGLDADGKQQQRPWGGGETAGTPFRDGSEPGSEAEQSPRSEPASPGTIDLRA